MSSYYSPTPSSLFDRAQGTPSSMSSYGGNNANAPSLTPVPLPHGIGGQVPPQLHLLLGNASTSYIKFNVAFPFNPAYISPNLNPRALDEHALVPSVAGLRLRVSAINLVFDVTNPRGVLVSDVFHTVFKYLQQPLSRDFYSSLPVHVREATDKAYQVRLQKAASRHIHGINERVAFVDCLGEKSHFYALSYAPHEGVWEVLLV
ncbi:hypothetical protein AX15_002385 [Amanita polypyramis BW_CC]|nr:hypothetical protein AX15_002385 [Amanita polypyramis BW_CC]